MCTYRHLESKAENSRATWGDRSSNERPPRRAPLRFLDIGQTAKFEQRAGYENDGCFLM
jgi:hypothetical protein